MSADRVSAVPGSTPENKNNIGPAHVLLATAGPRAVALLTPPSLTPPSLALVCVRLHVLGIDHAYRSLLKLKL